MSVFAAAALAVSLSVVAAAGDEFAFRMLDVAEEIRLVGPSSIDDRPASGRSEPATLATRLIGSFKSEGNDPALMLHIAPVAIEGLPGALYFEVARADSPWAPFRQGIMQEFTKRGVPTLRVFDLAGSSTLKDALVGMWAQPAAFPPIAVSSLSPNLDLAITPPKTSGAPTVASTGIAYPTIKSGAVEMTSRMEVTDGGSGGGAGASRVVICDRGFDASGTQVWGPAADPGIAFVRTTPEAAATKRDDGLTIINLVPPADPAGPRLAPGGTLVCHFSFWLADGTLVESSRKEGRVPFRSAVPGTPIKGFDAGVQGMGVGERRRLVVPPDLAYGKDGARNSIPPDATLIFDIECLSVENPTEAAPSDNGSPPADMPGK
ncbi:MAG: FKBP-type peptidyl-prolyl cis-trans isomerase [Phycisphaeraceae bacterium]|nr:FKBP-type peptidyl-prolyl cis-trans isomerase [Phycisphaeraceae bacterium]